MHLDSEFFDGDFLVADDPGVFDFENRVAEVALARDPPLKAEFNVVQSPKTGLILASFDMRPGKEDPAMVRMIFREIVSQSFSVQTIDGMEVTGVLGFGGGGRRADLAVIVNENRFSILVESQGRVIQFDKAKGSFLSGNVGVQWACGKDDR